MGTELGVLKKKHIFLCCFCLFAVFFAVLRVEQCLSCFFLCFLGFSWCNLVETQLLAPRKHCFFIFFGINGLPDVSWFSVFPRSCPFCPCGFVIFNVFYCFLVVCVGMGCGMCHVGYAI